MNYKIILAKNIKYSDVQPENKIVFLLDYENQLPTFNSQRGVRRQFEELFKAKIRFGYSFFQAKKRKCYFCISKNKKASKKLALCPIFKTN